MYSYVSNKDRADEKDLSDSILKREPRRKAFHIVLHDRAGCSAVTTTGDFYRALSWLGGSQLSLLIDGSKSYSILVVE